MAINHYDLGDLVRLTAAFTNDAGVAVDPTTVTVEVIPPSGVKDTSLYGTDADVVRDSAGNYHIDVDVSTGPGTWYYRWSSTGSGQAAEEARFIVDKSTFV